VTSAGGAVGRPVGSQRRTTASRVHRALRVSEPRDLGAASWPAASPRTPSLPRAAGAVAAAGGCAEAEADHPAVPATRAEGLEIHRPPSSSRWTVRSETGIPVTSLARTVLGRLSRVPALAASSIMCSRNGRASTLLSSPEVVRRPGRAGTGDLSGTPGGAAGQEPPRRQRACSRQLEKIASTATRPPAAKPYFEYRCNSRRSVEYRTSASASVPVAFEALSYLHTRRCPTGPPTAKATSTSRRGWVTSIPEIQVRDPVGLSPDGPDHRC